MKIRMFATTDNGYGYSEQVGEFEELEDIQIRCRMFKEDVVITFEEEPLQKE